ncbi:MAG: hypothetical protein M1383_04435 [Patescibacteria group bacterium]|nr:hypothetical protein [Patescibacteria group bacterium]
MPTKEELKKYEEELFGSFSQKELENPITKQSFDERLRNIRALRSSYACN